MADIKECPFCGSKNVWKVESTRYKKKYYVHCPDCKAGGPLGTAETAVEKWNKVCRLGNFAKDMNGEPINMRDTLYLDNSDKPMIVTRMMCLKDGWTVCVENDEYEPTWIRSSLLSHVKSDPWEEIEEGLLSLGRSDYYEYPNLLEEEVEKMMEQIKKVIKSDDRD